MDPGLRRDDTEGLAARERPLLRQQRIGPGPTLRRRVDLELLDAYFIELEQLFQRVRILAPAAAFDRVQRALPVAAAVAGEHFDGDVAQALEGARMHHVRAAGDGVDHFRLGLALDHDEVELENRELVLGGERGPGANDYRKAVFFRLA